MGLKNPILHSPFFYNLDHDRRRDDDFLLLVITYVPEVVLFLPRAFMHYAG